MTTLRPELLDELLADYETPEDLLGDEGLFKQLKKALLERAPGTCTHDYRREEARARCLAIESGARSGRPKRAAVPTFGAFVAGPGQACFERCRPSTRNAATRTLNGRLLPAFGSLPLDRLTRAGVTRWLDEYSRTAPGGANRTLDLLRRILNHAIACGHLQTNPARGIKRNPRPKLTRFSLARGAPPPPPRAGPLCRHAAVAYTAGGHHPPSVADQLSEERDHDHALAEHRRGHA